MTKHKPALPILITPHSLSHSYITLKVRHSETMGDLITLRDQASHRHLSTTLDLYVCRSKGYVDTSKSDI